MEKTFIGGLPTKKGLIIGYYCCLVVLSSSLDDPLNKITFQQWQSILCGFPRDIYDSLTKVLTRQKVEAGTRTHYY